jgi:hypothetical protein
LRVSTSENGDAAELSGTRHVSLLSQRQGVMAMAKLSQSVRKERGDFCLATDALPEELFELIDDLVTEWDLSKPYFGGWDRESVLEYLFSIAWRKHCDTEAFRKLKERV